MPFALVIWLPYRRLNRKETLSVNMTETPIRNGSQNPGFNMGENSGANSEENNNNNHKHWYKAVNWTRLYSALDIIGIILLIAIFAFLLVPLVADGEAAERFSKKWLIALLVIGITILIPTWILWEWKQGEDALVPLNVGISLT
jgi:hypothetical protein